MTAGAGGLRRAAGFLGHRLREARLYAAMAPRLRPGARRPRLLCLPSGGREMSSLLRVHLIAEALAGRGWAPLMMPPQLEARQRARVLRAFDPDLILMQKSRHRLNEAWRLEGRPFVYDIDDADFADPALAPRIEAACREARGVIAGSRHVAEWCGRFNANVEVVWTGTPLTPGPRPPQVARAPIVTWAQSSPHRYLPELAMVERALIAARARLPALRFRIYGWDASADPAPLARLEAAGIEIERAPRMPYEAFLRSLQETAVGLAPVCADSAFMRGKSFGKILAYLDAKVPAIASDAVDHALLLDGENGLVSDDPETWGAEIARLLGDPQARQRIADRGFETLEKRLSTQAAAAQVDAFIAPLARRAPPGRPPAAGAALSA